MATTSFSTKFDLSLTPKQFILVDTFGYVAAGIALADVNGVFESIVAPSGSVIYTNTDYSDSGCNIQNSVSRTNKVQISLPVDNYGNVELGVYTITYKVYDKNLAEYYTQVNTYDYEYVAPEIEIDQNVNIIGQVFSQTDNTNYVVNGVTPTLSRVNKLTYPAGVAGGPPTPITVTGATLTTTIFFNGTQTSTITSTVLYTFPDGLMVADILFGSKEFLVDGSYFCSLICGLKAYEKKLCGCNGDTLVTYQKNFTLAMSYVTLVMAEINCNGGSGISCYLDEIKKIIGDCNCGCDDDDDDQFSRITGWGTILGLNGTNGTNGINGTNGTNGTNGKDGADLLVNNIVVNTPSTGAYASLKSYTLLANQLSADGDALEVTALIETANFDTVKNVKLIMGGTDMMPKLSALGYLKIQNPCSYMRLRAVITRKSATTVFVEYTVEVSTVTPSFTLGGHYSFYEPSVTISNLGTLTNLIDVQGQASGGDTVVCKQLMVKYLKKI